MRRKVFSWQGDITVEDSHLSQCAQLLCLLAFFFSPNSSFLLRCCCVSGLCLLSRYNGGQTHTTKKRESRALQKGKGPTVKEKSLYIRVADFGGLKKQQQNNNSNNTAESSPAPAVVEADGESNRTVVSAPPGHFCEEKKQGSDRRGTTS